MWRTGRARGAILVAALLLAAGLSACMKLSEFRGTWSGTIEQSEDVRAGFGPGTELTLNIEGITERVMSGTISTCVRGFEQDQCQPGRFQDAVLNPLEKAQNDDLRTMTFGGDPYAVYLFTVQPADPNDTAMLCIVSVHSEHRVEVRLLRGQDVFGVFRLKKQKK